MNINELEVMLQIIDKCAERGAFKGTELYSVGVIRDSIVKDIKKHNEPVEVYKGED